VREKTSELTAKDDEIQRLRLQLEQQQVSQWMFTFSPN
jgi:hypothetical protein